MSTGRPTAKKGLLAVLQLVLVIGLLMSLRWLFYEPFVIPSGSMIPSLLINDHVIVNKNIYGVRYPFTETFINAAKVPERGEIVVFKSVSGNYFMIKRVLALPGEEFRIDKSGQVFINNEPLKRQLMEDDDPRLSKFSKVDLKTVRQRDYYVENEKYITRQLRGDFDHSYAAMTVPEGHVLMIGDNRDNSADSRFWGPLPLKNLIGKATSIWMSCEVMLKDIPFCNLSSLRSNRIFKSLD